jgi:hypothetical protein
MAETTYMDDIANEILALDDIPETVLTVIDWKRDVLVRGGDAEERYRLEKLLAAKSKDQQGMKTLYADLTVLAARDPETGNRIFRSSHRDALLAKSGRACSQIAREYLKLTGFLEEEIKEAEKNSEAVDGSFGSE